MATLLPDEKPKGRRRGTRLLKLKVNEISLVDSGANGGARVVLMKRAGAPGDSDGVGNMADDKSTPTLEELAEAVAKAGADNDRLATENAKLNEQLETVRKAGLVAKDEQLTALTKQLGEISEQNKQLAGKVETLTEQRDTQTYITKAKLYSHLPFKPEELAPALRAIDGMGDSGEVLTKLLGTLDGSMAELLKALPGVGRPQLDPASPQAQLESLVAKYQTDNPKADEAHAWDEVLKSARGRELYAQSVEKRN